MKGASPSHATSQPPFHSETSLVVLLTGTPQNSQALAGGRRKKASWELGPVCWCRQSGIYEPKGVMFRGFQTQMPRPHHLPVGDSGEAVALGKTYQTILCTPRVANCWTEVKDVQGSYIFTIANR